MDDRLWRKSSFSGGTGGGNDNCVEIALTDEAAAVRDSKNSCGPILALPVSALSALLRQLS
ncbi:DUF397 domain-containing protein [Actinophytocola algeriensis]|uniref:DUF397 domain-containing protein n=1 Tax=Actinophytocola algeriensis TaxID=1768010 RepID=A0A7W7Q8Y3_9PSEU|nr:DUF397 domain-containing protein [Actinophytocola algeriensis]MBB4909023.1 hypothetical protein [Actinophytocola algeriensis]MBE1474589.1 hypothetical protein [Actinophytocola algeriensis]